MVLLRNGHLTAVVRGDIILEGCTNLLTVHPEVNTHSDGGQQIVDVIGANEMRLYLVPLGAAPLFLECHQWLAPTELQERIAFYHLA